MNAFKTAYAMAFLYDMAIERRTLANFWVFQFFLAPISLAYRFKNYYYFKISSSEELTWDS